MEDLFQSLDKFITTINHCFYTMQHSFHHANWRGIPKFAQYLEDNYRSNAFIKVFFFFLIAFIYTNKILALKSASLHKLPVYGRFKSSV